MRRRRPPRTVSAGELAHYRAHFLEAVRDDGAVCLECGDVFRAMGNHLRKHHLTADDYKERWGYNRQTALMIPALSEAAAVRARAQGGPPPLEEATLRKLWRSRRGLVSVRQEARLKRSARARARVAAGWRPPGPPKKVADDTLRALAAEGLSASQISARIGVVRSSVRQRARALGLALRNMDPRLSKVATAEVLALREAGLTNGEIAARTGLRLSAVRNRFRRLQARGAAVPVDPRRQRWPTDEQLLTLHREGLNAPAMAARLGFTKSYVRQRFWHMRRRGFLPAKPARVSHDEEVLALRRAGLWTSEIAARTGLTVRGVLSRLQRLRNQGVAVPTPARPWPNRLRRVSDDQLLRLAQEGLGRRDMAARVGLSLRALDKRLFRLRRQGLLPPAAPANKPA